LKYPPISRKIFRTAGVGLLPVRWPDRRRGDAYGGKDAAEAAKKAKATAALQAAVGISLPEKRKSDRSI
jgi:hypothetical protein